MVRDDVEAVIEALRHARGRATGADGARHFYAVRDERFNALRRDVHASADPASAYTPALAAMLIYLNRTGYNGLFRLNSRGGFNVPAGRYAKVDASATHRNLRRLSRALRRPGLTRRGQPVRGRARRGSARAISSTSTRRTRRSAGRRSSRPTPRRLRARRAGSPAAGGDRARARGRVRAAQQFGGPGDPAALRGQRRGAVRRPAEPEPSRPAAPSTRARPGEAPCASTSITNIV